MPLPRNSDVTLFVMGNIVHMDVREVFAVIFLGFEVCVAARTGEIGLIPKLYFPGFTKTSRKQTVKETRRRSSTGKSYSVKPQRMRKARK